VTLERSSQDDRLPWVDREAAAVLDAALPDRDWSIPAPGSTRSEFAAPSGELAVVSVGDPSGPRVVLVPGVTGSKEDFVLLAPLLAEAGYFVQSYDLAGQYESADAGPAPTSGGRYDYDLFVADLVAFLEAGAPAHLLGYSFAGIVAQLVVAKRQDLVLSLTLLTTPPEPGQGFRGVRWIGWASPAISAHATASLLIWGIVTNKNKVPPKRLEFVRSRFPLTRRSSVDDIVGLMKHAPDVRPAIAAAPLPKMIATGDHDLWPLTLHERFAKSIGASIAVYRTGHSPCETAPHQLASDMLALFRRAESAGSNDSRESGAS
jgi:pimeloyl-ACP methyl ester carboxylesterase